MDSLVRRNLLPRGEELLGAFPAVVIRGARQVGKSALAQMLVAGKPHVRLSLDDEDVRAAALADPRGFAAQADAGTLVIDEIQRELSLLLAIKSAIDADRRPGRFLLTGSSDLLRLSRTPDSPAGRALTLELHGLSQGEVAGESMTSRAGSVRRAAGCRALRAHGREATTSRFLRAGIPRGA